MRTMGMILLPGSLFLIARGIAIGLKTLDFIRRSVVTTGTITENAAEYDNSGTRYLYHPIAEFTVAGKIKYKSGAGVGANPPSYKIGQKVKIRYLRENPNVARIDSFLQNWFEPLAAIFLGLVFTFFSLKLLGVNF